MSYAGQWKIKGRSSKSITDKIIIIMMRARRPLRAAEIADTIGHPAHNVRTLMQECLKNGKMRRVENGLYRLTGEV